MFIRTNFTVYSKIYLKKPKYNTGLVILDFLCKFLQDFSIFQFLRFVLCLLTAQCYSIFCMKTLLKWDKSVKQKCQYPQNLEFLVREGCSVTRDLARLNQENHNILSFFKKKFWNSWDRIIDHTGARSDITWAGVFVWTWV